MKIHQEESIGLTSTIHNDESNFHSGTHIPSSEPLLDYSTTSHPRKSKWDFLPFPNNLTKKRRRRPRGRSDSDLMRPGRRKGCRVCFILGIGVLLLLGVVQLVTIFARIILPNGVRQRVKIWGRPGHLGAGLASWPTDFSRDILPIPCHSHNDYWRTVPLYSAIEAGCIGVEADIWLFDEQLYVGHSVQSLTPNRTLHSLYIDPLLDILSKQNHEHRIVPEQDTQVHGVFDTNPEKSLILLIDFKTAGATLWPYVQAALESLRSRNYLTHANGTDIVPGPITIVGTGNTPFDLVISDESNPHQDIFFDAPLSDMYDDSKIEGNHKSVPVVGHRRSDEEGQGKSGTTGDPDVFNPGNSYYASVAFGKAIGELHDGEFSDRQLDLLRGQIRGAHKRGLKSRYWDLPFWPISLRNHVWDVLVKEGVDLLNVDDLKAATRRDWDKYIGWSAWRKKTLVGVHEG